ncbi:MAG: SDR family oxidoreductase [Methanobacteriota archaeon]|nr:MAG: SDR family oxidoreductase [Euryarchaeota archaeon]
MVNLVVFGATGETGRWIADRAVQAGHEVTAFVRDPGRMHIVHDRVKVVRGDVLDAASADGAIAGQDAVLSALGSSARNPAPVLSTGVRHILDAMERHHVRRIVALSAAGALGESAGFLFGNLGLRIFRMWLPEVYREHRKMLVELQPRDVDWTAVRAVLLTNATPKGRYRVAVEGIPRWGFRISRADVAEFMVRQLTSDEFVRKMPAIAY